MTDHRPPPTARPSFADAAEIDAFVETLGRFERGELDADAWRAYRVPRGVYEQRQDGFHMLRVKIPQGVATGAQLRALAEVADRYSRGFGHVTTRENLQLHFVRPEHLEAALRRLGEAGITTSGACGNAVRNVLACPRAGVAHDELFDVTPYAEAVSRHFLRHPLAMSLPRKFKIAFEGCADDHVATPVQDLGFRARVREEGGVRRRGFAVTAAGGTATLCASGAILVEFLPAGDVLALAEAVVRVFHARGDREHRQRNRTKFLVRQLGFEAYRTLVGEALAAVRAEGAPALPFDAERPPEEAAPAPLRRPPAPAPEAIAARVRAAPPRGPGLPPEVVPVLAPGDAAFDLFQATNVRAQRQAGYAIVTALAPQGDLTSPQLEVLAELARAYGDGTVRFTNDQHVVLRWVREAWVAAVFERLAAAGLGLAGAGSAADVVSCPGSESCRVAVTHSRGVARLVEERLRAKPGALATPLAVRVSGCPNGCSLHHLAGIGLQGSVRKEGGRPVPQYFVMIGGAVEASGARFAERVAKIPARRIPDAIERLLALHAAEARPGEAAADFFARARERAEAVLAPLEAFDAANATPEDFADLGEDVPAGAGGVQGERAA